MIKLFSLKQQKKDGEAGGQQKTVTRSAAQLRITKGKIDSKILFLFLVKIFILNFDYFVA